MPPLDEPNEEESARLRAENAVLQRQVASLEKTEREARAQTGALSRALELLTSEPELDSFLNLILGVMGEHLGVQYVALWLHDKQRDTLHFDRVYRRGDAADDGQSGRVLTGAQVGHPSALRPVASRELPVWEEMNRTRRPVVVSDVASDPRIHLYREELAERGIETVLHIPFLMPEGAIGYLGAATKKRDYTEDQLAIIQAIAHPMTLAIQLARQARQQRDEARNTAVLRERNRIARDIHDTLAQSLTAVLFQAQAATGALDRETPEPQTALRHLSRVSALTGEGLEEARRAVFALRPLRLESAGDGSTLGAARARLCDERRAQSGVSAHYLQEGAPQPLSPRLEAGLLRVAQESLFNVTRHAEASAVWVELAFENGAVALRVQDNGLGVEAAALRAFEMRKPQVRTDGGGLGLAGLRERAEALGGTLTLSSRPGQGTEVRVVVPLDDAPIGDAPAQDAENRNE